MVERVAVVIAACEMRGATADETARDVIAAMREPTEGMTEASWAVDDEKGDPHAGGETHWQAMIDEALK